MKQTEPPLTVISFAEKLHTCGVVEGQTILVHMAMSKLRYIVGGAEAVIFGLMAAVGETGTIMMPTFSSNNIDPSEWQHPPASEVWWQLIRDNTPPYNPAITPTRNMGVVAELFRTFPGVIRSAHPAFSMAAYGPNAATLMADHSLTEDTGNCSPVGKLCELDGYVLLLGVDHWNNTSLHLAEWRANYPGKRTLQTGSSMLIDGRQHWVAYETMETYAGDFGEIGDAFDATCGITIQHINDAQVRFFKQRPLVEFAVQWMELHRNLTT